MSDGTIPEHSSQDADTGATAPSRAAIPPAPGRRHLRAKLLGLVLACLIILAAIVFGALYVWHREHQLAGQNGAGTTATGRVQARAVCSDDILQKSADAIESYKRTELGAYVDGIVKQQGYAQDPSCVYVILRYNIMNNETDKAQDNLKRLKQFGSSTDAIRFNDSLRPVMMSFKDIQATIGAMEFNNKMLQQAQPPAVPVSQEASS